MDVHLRDLRYFVAVAGELHFGRAAQRLFISQPALSRQVAKLERDLGITLLERDRRSVTLTPAGREMLERATMLLACWDETRRAVSDRAAAAAAVLRVGMQTSLGRGIVARLHAALTVGNPLARIELITVDWDDPTVGLGGGQVDIAVGWLPLLDPEEFTTTVLATEPCHLAVPTGHRLAGRRSVTFTEIVDERFIALPQEAGPLRSFWLADTHRDAPATIAAVAHNAEEALEAVGSGLGVVLLAEGNAQLYRRDQIVTLEVTDLPPAQLALIARAEEHSLVIQSLINTIASTETIR